MSYVIQNFNNLARNVVITPRFKYLIIFNNMDLILFFFKTNSFVVLNSFFQFHNFNHFSLIYRFFFIKQYPKMCRNLNLNLSNMYTNNLTKSAVYSSLVKINESFEEYPRKMRTLKYENALLYNNYFLAIKIANVRVHKRLFKNMFFFMILFTPHLWYQHDSNLKFYLNFFFVTYHLQMYNFYNGYFFRIYNF